jgi:hypothetical protein
VPVALAGPAASTIERPPAHPLRVSVALGPDLALRGGLPATPGVAAFVDVRTAAGLGLAFDACWHADAEPTHFPDWRLRTLDFDLVPGWRPALPVAPDLGVGLGVDRLEAENAGDGAWAVTVRASARAAVAVALGENAVLGAGLLGGLDLREVHFFEATDDVGHLGRGWLRVSVTLGVTFPGAPR